MNSIGQLFRLTTFGESHGTAIGGIVDGCPAGLSLDEKAIQKELGENEGFYVKGSDMNNVSGYNLDAQCYNKDGTPDLQCNQVMTYNNSCSAQGLGSSSCPMPGHQDSVGAPFDCNN